MMQSMGQPQNPAGGMFAKVMGVGGGAQQEEKPTGAANPFAAGLAIPAFHQKETKPKPKDAFAAFDALQARKQPQKKEVPKPLPKIKQEAPPPISKIKDELKISDSLVNFDCDDMEECPKPNGSSRFEVSSFKPGRNDMNWTLPETPGSNP